MEEEQWAKARRIIEALVDYKANPYNCDLAIYEVEHLALEWARKYGSEKAKQQAISHIGEVQE